MTDQLDLWDYRQRVAEIYAAVRAQGPGEEAWRSWVDARDRLFATHPQTPLDDPTAFSGLTYFAYDPSWRTIARFRPDEAMPWGEFTRIGWADFEVRSEHGSLPVFWLDSYGGGIFVPFRDGTSGDSTYGGGRYLLDGAKGADLGHDGSSIVFDFNYAYHPSCVHSDRWVCPLAPTESRLEFEVTAGERLAPRRP